MTARTEIDALFQQINTDLSDHATLAALTNDDAVRSDYNNTLYEARHRATLESLRILADKIDRL